MTADYAMFSDSDSSVHYNGQYVVRSWVTAKPITAKTERNFHLLSCGYWNSEGDQNLLHIDFHR